MSLTRRELLTSVAPLAAAGYLVQRPRRPLKAISPPCIRLHPTPRVLTAPSPASSAG